MMTNPRQAEIEAALAGFEERVRQGKVPKKRRYARVVGGIVGSHQHQRRKRKAQRKRAGNWSEQPTLWRPHGGSSR